MAEISLPWGGTVTGDAGPYSDDNWSDTWRELFTNDPTTQGYIAGYLNELEVTGVATPIEVDTGAGIVDGKFYRNSVVVQISIPTPSVSTRIDLIVLRKSWSAQITRITRIAGAEGGVAPTPVQVDGTTWDIPLAEASVTTGGVITVTDRRVACETPLSGGGSAPFDDGTAIIKGSADPTKLLRLEVDGFTTATTRVLTPPNFDGTIATLAGTSTLTNKRITPRITSEASSATPTINTDNTDIHRITALAAAITSMTTNLSGTPTHGQKLMVEILDDGTGRAIAWGASFRSTDVGVLPTTTVANKLLAAVFFWDSVDSVWECRGVSNEA